MNQQICKNCFSTDIESNEAKGEVICLNCGTVLEENQIVESLEFVENHNGGISMVGQFIPSSGGKSYIMSMGLRDSREAALQRGYSNIQKIADHLHLPIQIVEAAQRLYLIALQRNFTMGRNNSYVAAACLYTICRREKSPIMLIDFSDVLQAPMKPLGQTFLKLLRLLHMSVPNIDPSLFLERFAHKLNLKNDIFKVTYTGIKLIQAMTRDWISTGRRPTGLCGAALLISTRIHGLSIDPMKIADVVRISKPTLIKRLSEFKNTNVAKIKAADFDNISLANVPFNKLPPCVVHGNNKKKKEKEKTNYESLEILDKDDKDVVSMFLDKNETVLQLSEYPNKTMQVEKEIEVSMNETKKISSKINSSISESTRGSTNENVSDDTSLIMSDNLSSKASDDLNVHIEEMCNDNPKAYDINNLAQKIIHTISKEKNVDLLKNVNPKMLLSNEKNRNSSCSSSLNAENAEISDQYLQSSSYSLDIINAKVLDNDSCSSLPINSKKNVILKEAMSNKDIEKNDLQKKSANKKNKDSNDNESISEFSTSANTVFRDLYNENEFFFALNNEKIMQYQKENVINIKHKEKDKEKKNGDCNVEEIYSTTLSETINSELNKTLCDIDELPFLHYVSKKDNENENRNIDMLKVKKHNIENETSNINEFFPELNYFFDDNTTNSVNEMNNNYETNSDGISITLNDETLSDIATDSEMESMILSEKEKNIKMTIWDDMMKNYMPIYCKQLKKKKKNVGQNIVKKRKVDTPKPIEDKNTTQEVVLKVLEQSDKHMFSKINCDVLNSMFSS